MPLNEILNIKRDIAQVANDSYSYFNFNQQLIDRQKYNMWEGNHKLLDRFYKQVGGASLKPIKVVFMVADTALWDVFQSVYYKLLLDSEFELKVIVFRRVDVQPDKSYSEVVDFFSKQSIAADIVWGHNTDYPPIAPEDADVVFYTLGSAAFPDVYKMEYVSTYCRTCYLSYGFLLINAENYQFAQDFHHSAWAIYASTRREVQLYQKYTMRYSSNVVLTGYPKFDLLDFRKIKVNKPKRPIIIWAPHWTIGLCYPSINLGTFDQICMDIIEVFSSFSEIDFIFKPHPNLLYALDKTTFMTQESYIQYLSLLLQCTNVSIYNHGDYCNLFLKSSAMITDSVSFLAEYLPTGNPLLFLSRKDRVKFSDVGEEIIRLHYHGEGIESIKNFIQQIIYKQDDSMKDLRVTKAFALLEIEEINSADKIRDHLLQNFGRALPQQDKLHC